MSNATHDSRNSGDNRRRRSRGGQNRNNNHSHNEDRQGGDRESRGRGQGQNRGQHQGRRDDGARSGDFHPQASRPARKYSAPKLNWWQKLLKAVGLYKEPARPERAPEIAKPAAEPRAPKSNTRNARSNEGGPAAPEKRRENDRQQTGERQQSGERQRSGERPPRGDKRANGREDRPRGGDRAGVESPRVYVGNLSYDVTEQDLQELFKGIGGVRNVEVVYNRATHRSKGYGFVEMLHMDEALRAVEVLHDQPFMGRKMTVSGAKSKGQDEREDHEDRPEREARPVQVAPTHNPQVTAAVENVEAVGAPEVIVETVEHVVAEATGETAPEPSVEKPESH